MLPTAALRKSADHRLDKLADSYTRITSLFLLSLSTQLPQGFERFAMYAAGLRHRTVLCPEMW